ncbi:MAG: DNA helicase UvrD [Candidatus Diapherotrites archaeon]|nr:DNA helicase UvrD [Candidatus Diapherotrites archaeon]
MSLVYADLHIHSRFSRGTSNSLDLRNLEKYARMKGLNVLGSSDFTHPEWLAELKQNLTQEQDGIYQTKTGFDFLLSTELSLIYSQGGKTRKIHHVVLAPSFEVVDQINEELDKWGRRDYDGRPIFGKSSIEFVDTFMSISRNIEIIPAHAWTPYFGIFGSMSGFDSLEECFEEKTKYIHAIETGLSSDPAMNWRLSELDGTTLLSFSDAHSYWPWRLGRECTVFDLKEASYTNIINAIRKKKLHSTIEYFPEQGKYHWDGHRNCGVSFSPKETRKHKGICPVCRRPLTLGVEYRVEELADRPQEVVPDNAIPFKKLVPLSELLAGVLKKGVATNTVWEEYNKLLSLGSEFDVLLNALPSQLAEVTGRKIVNAIMRNREGKIKIQPGYDGVYGVPLFGGEAPTEKPQPKPSQKKLGDY